MEIEFNNVTYYKNYNTPFQKKILSKLCMNIELHKINVICGDESLEVIGKLMCALELPTKGSVCYKNYDIKLNSYIRNINTLRKDIGYVYSNPSDYLFGNTVRKEIEYGIKHYNYRLNNIGNRPQEALKILGLDESYLNLSPLKLSFSEQKKVAIASVIAYNPSVIIFDNVEKGLCRKDQNNIIRLIKLLNKKYNKTIILLSNDLNFLLSFCDNYYFVDNGKLHFSCNKDNLFNVDFPPYMISSPIIDIIKYAQKKGSKIESFYEINELIKGVYRDVR